MQINNTRYLTSKIVDAYLEMVYGAMTLRVPEVQKIMSQIAPEACVTSSYSHQQESLIIKGKEILEKMSKEGLKNINSLKNTFIQINSMFLTSMWDILTLHQNYNSIATEAEIQFFRHVRNGCAHNGRLNFSALRYPAKWRDKEISENMKGLPIFPNLLADGDPIILVLDINNKFFNPITIN